MISSRWLWATIILVSAVMAAALVVGDVAHPVRPALVLWFVVICPGMAFVRLLAVGDRLVALTLAIALSLAIDTIVAAILLYFDAWQPTWGFIAILVITLCGATIEVWWPVRRRPAAS